MILTREEFITRFDLIMRSEKIGYSCAEEDHPIWVAESQMSMSDFFNYQKCGWFACVKPVDFSEGKGSDYWDWITSTLTGETVCFASDKFENEEWWGFTNKEDIMIWTLKWAR